MATRREWLVEKGLAKPGRGKFSNEAKDAIAKAIAEGVVFDDAAPSAPASPKPRKEKPSGIVKDDVIGIAGGEAMFANEMPHYGKEWFIRTAKGKRIDINEKAVCVNCRYSLIAHVCNLPKVLSPSGGGFVSVEAK